MNICIVTLYNSVNSGSFWQAKALEIVLRKMGHNVFFFHQIGHPETPKSKKNNFSIYFRYLLKGRFGAIYRFHYTLKEFACEQGKFCIIENDLQSIDKMDCFILGSDTIWNLDSKFLSKYKTSFWGGAFQNKKVFSFAGSAGSAERTKYQGCEELNQYINSWTSVGVRDTYTRSIFKTMTKHQISIVCDPTMLLRKEDYREMISAKKEHPYIFVYMFHNFSKKHFEELVHFARKNSLKILYGVLKDWGDKKNIGKAVINSPYRFLYHMYHADYVITDTFHGTVFSINLNKQFITIENGQKQIDTVLESLEFQDRLVKAEESLERCLNHSIKYEEKNEKVEILRNSSMKFLRDSLTCDA